MACFQFYYLQATQDWAGRCFSQLVALTANYFVFGKQFKDYKKEWVRIIFLHQPPRILHETLVFLDKTGDEFFLDAIVNSIHFYLTCIQIK
ncbi:hypothetical protein [Pedobacter sp. P26]|uniref:hypothetical protein n=1 Tax=Pedobacter sp. P26 TaxID=3423956 RepID=UPI003D66A736